MTPRRHEPQHSPTPPFSTSSIPEGPSDSISSEDTVGQLYEEIETQHGLIEVLERKLNSAREDVQNLRFQRNSLENHYQRAIRDHLERVEWIRSQLDNVGKSLADANQRQALAETELDEAKALARDLKNKLADAKEGQEDLKRQNNRLMKENKDLAKELTRAQERSDPRTSRHEAKRRMYAISAPRGERPSLYRIIKDMVR